MSSQEITAIATTIISALAIAIVNIIVAWKTNANVQALATSTSKDSGRAEKKLDEIHVLTNSNLKKVTVELSAANDRIAKLEAMLEKLAADAAAEVKKAATDLVALKTKATVLPEKD